MPASATSTIRVLCADDHPVARRGLRVLLGAAEEIEIVGETHDGDQVLAAVEVHRPDVVVLDLFMPGRSVLGLVPELRERHPSVRVVIITMTPEPAYARRALALGVHGYVLKDGDDDELVGAIRAAARDERFLTPRLAGLADAQGDARSSGGFSARQLEILTLLALGYTNAQIGTKLGLSVRTVESHRAHIQHALHCRDRAGVVAFALDQGLIGGPA